MYGNVSGVIVLQEVVSGLGHSHCSNFLFCLLYCWVWRLISYKEAFHILW